MNTETILNRIDKAVHRAERHLAGDRDGAVPNYMDPQVERFLQTLHQMRNTLTNPSASEAPRKYMGMAVADGWSYESELGKLVCEAEDAFHSQVLPKSC